MLPDEHEYRVGPRGYVTERDGATVRYEPGSLVWLRKAPVGADLVPTGKSRKYETKGLTPFERGLTEISEALIRRRRRGPSEEACP